jgi:hypothetical protein
LTKTYHPSIMYEWAFNIYFKFCCNINSQSPINFNTLMALGPYAPLPGNIFWMAILSLVFYRAQAIPAKANMIDLCEVI